MAATPTSASTARRKTRSESPSDGIDVEMMRGELVTLEMRLVGGHAVEHMLFEAIESLTAEFGTYLQVLEVPEPFQVLCSVLGLEVHREGLRRQGDPAFDIQPGDLPHPTQGTSPTEEGKAHFAHVLMDVEVLGNSLLDLTDALDLAQTPDEKVESTELCSQLLATARKLCGDEMVRRPFTVALRGATATVCGRLQKLNDASGVLGLKHVQLLRHCMRVATTESLGIQLDLVLDLYRTMQAMETVQDPSEAVTGVLQYAERLAPYDAELKTAVEAIQKGESPTWQAGKAAQQRARRGSQQLMDLLPREFDRHDVDKDGQLVGAEELTQVCTALCAKLRLLVAPEEIAKRVEAALKMKAAWSQEAFEDWFAQAFGPVPANQAR